MDQTCSTELIEKNTEYVLNKVNIHFSYRCSMLCIVSPRHWDISDKPVVSVEEMVT